VAPPEEEGGSGDVHPHAQPAVGKPLDRERVVDLGGLVVVDRERGHRRLRQAGGAATGATSGKPSPSGKNSKAKRRRK